MYNVPIYKDRDPIEIKRLVFNAKRMLPDMVFNMSDLEGNPFTFPEVQTLIDGVTVGGHKLSDQDQVLRIRDSWKYVFEIIQAFDGVVTKETLNLIHHKVANNEALESGVFRSGNVGISGSDYTPPDYSKLDDIFKIGISQLYDEYKTSKTSLAIAMFLFGARNQFYWDGNKRTSRLMSNLILINAGQGILNVKAKTKLEFNTLMVEFYNTGDGAKIAEFLYNSIER